MQRIIWIGGIACLAQVACIEDRTPTGDADAAVPDAAVPDAAEPEPSPPPSPEPREPTPIDPEPGNPEPDPNEPEPAEPEPNPELPPWICPPEGVFVFNVGACVAVGDDPPMPGRVEARIAEVGVGMPADGPCGPDRGQNAIGRVGSDRMRWFSAVTPDGEVWQIVLDLPVEIRFAVGEDIVIDAQVEAAFFSGLTGSLAISTAAGLQAFVHAGDRGAPQLNDPELQLGVGGQSCDVNDPESDFCTYTGHRLSASDPRVDVVQELSYGQVVDVGPFQVINGGILSIGDLGACNAPPEDFKVAAWRRR